MPRKHFYLGIVGSRRRNTPRDKKLVRLFIEKMQKKYGETLRLVSGACPQGADHFAAELAEEMGIRIIEYAVNKEEVRDLIAEGIPPRGAFAKVAFARNRLIAKRSDMLFALVASDRKGGTENTLKHAKEFGIPIKLG